jgi:hypothetical protein
MEQRFARHLLLARLGHKGMPIYDAIRALSEAAFTVECLYEAASSEEMYVVERGLIAMHGTKIPLGYNLVDGGRGGIRPRSEDGKRRHSEKMKAKWADPEYRKRLGKAISIAQASPEVRAKMSAGIGAARRTAESRAKTSAQMLRLMRDPDYAARRIAAYRATCAKGS